MIFFAIVSVVFCVVSGASQARVLNGDENVIDDLRAAAVNPYCNIATCAGRPGGVKNNTLCLFTNTSYGGWCAPNYKLTVSAADIQTILTVSNGYRSKVALGNELRGNPGPQPRATNMRQLYWDNELANGAQTYAQRCVFAHDTCRDVSRFVVGQNLYILFSTAPITSVNWASAIKGWYDEVQYITPAAFASTPSSFPAMIGHYTQLVWANSYRVGCGIASFKDTKYNLNFPPYNAYPYKLLYVCNYGIAGNWVGQPVYAKGPITGTACPSGTKLVKATGLCA